MCVCVCTLLCVLRAHIQIRRFLHKMYGIRMCTYACAAHNSYERRDSFANKTNAKTTKNKNEQQQQPNTHTEESGAKWKRTFGLDGLRGCARASAPTSMSAPIRSTQNPREHTNPLHTQKQKQTHEHYKLNGLIVLICAGTILCGL